MADCAGDMTLGDKNAVLISKQNEEWLLSRIKDSQVKHLAFIPSHPFGYTAGKWREWYPDVVAEEGDQLLLKHKNKVELRRDYTAKERADLGEIEDAAYAVAETGRLMTNDLAVYKLYNKIAGMSLGKKLGLGIGIKAADVITETKING